MSDYTAPALRLRSEAAKHYPHFVILTWTEEGKWVMTISDGLDVERIKNLRDFLTREIDNFK